MMFVSISFCFLFVFLLLLIIYVCQFYINVKKYPSGPLPIPVFGNILMLIRKRKTHPLIALHDICQPYGDLCTFWFGSKPVVIINDLVIGKTAFNRVECSGRPATSMDLIVTGDGFQSYSTKDYTKEVQFLRKLSLETIRQLLSSRVINEIVNKVVTETVVAMKSRECDQQFSVDNYLSQIPIRIVAETTFGRRYCVDDSELKSIQHSLEIFNSEMLKLIFSDFFPALKYFLTSNENSKLELKKLNNLIRISFENCGDSYLTGKCDNTANSMITAKHLMIEQKRSVSKYLTDSNLIASLSSLFIGASDTTMATFKWIYLIIAYYPDMQQKIRDEINDKIGKSYPNVSDRKKFDYLNAFIYESLRFSGIVPFGLFHKTTEQINISNIAIPKNTMLLLNLYAILNDPKNWKDPQNFIPERFLDTNSCFIANRFPAFVPFSTGKRVCIGETMAIDLIFLILVCLIQATDGYQFVLANGRQNYDLSYCSNPTFILNPNPYRIQLKRL